jgi:hypothetical protein
MSPPRGIEWRCSGEKKGLEIVPQKEFNSSYVHVAVISLPTTSTANQLHLVHGGDWLCGVENAKVAAKHPNQPTG